MTAEMEKMKLPVVYIQDNATLNFLSLHVESQMTSVIPTSSGPLKAAQTLKTVIFQKLTTLNGRLLVTFSVWLQKHRQESTR